MDKVAKKWRGLLIETIEPYKDLPLFLSGGADSATLLAAQLALGAKPTVLSLTLSDYDSVDFLVSKEMAQTFDLNFIPVKIPVSRDVLVSDIKELVKFLDTSHKDRTPIQCGQCIKYLSIAASKIANEAIIGTGGIIEDCRQFGFILHKQGEEVAREYRRSSLYSSTQDKMSGVLAQFLTARRYGIELVEPYSMEPIASYGLSLDAAEINNPFQKAIAFRAFPEFWKAGSWRRINSSMQVNSGVRAWHDTLLKTEWNTGNYKNVRGIYNAIKKSSLNN